MKPLLSSLVRLNNIHQFASVRLIALDIDGTLAVSRDSGAAEFIRQLCVRLRRLGVLVTVATGRAFSGAQPIIANLSNKGAPVVLYNGALVADRQGRAVYYRATMPPQTVVHLAEIACSSGATIQAYNCRPSQHSIVDTSGKGLEETVVGWARSPGPRMEINRLPIEWRGFGDYDDVTEANAVLLAIDIASREAIAADLRSLPDITSTSSGESYIEVRPVGVTKASGLMEVINLLEIEASEVLAVGDNDNDTEMLQWAGIGVVVANATPSAIAAADFISARESAQGVIETLRLVQNSRRLFRDEWQPRSGLEKNKQFPDTF